MCSERMILMYDATPIFECRALSKSYGTMPALKNVSITLPRGRMIGLLGPNGSGKTTLIKLLVGLLKPTSGELTVDGNPIGERTKAVVSYLPERNSLALSLTPEEHIAYFRNFFPDFDEQRARLMMQDLAVPMDKPIRNFSKGMKEKLQLILVMSRRAKLYVLDEPIAGVDPAARDYIMDTIFKLRDPDSTLIVSTHLIGDIESVLDEFIFIRYGELVRYDSVESVHQSGETVDKLFREAFKWVS